MLPSDAKPRDHTRAFDATRGLQWAAIFDSEQLGCHATISSWITTLPQLGTLLSYRVDVETAYLNLTVVISPFNFLALSLSHHDNMPNPSTPPHSQDASNGRFSSKLTPLKHDRLGSQAHSSGPPLKASTLYEEMTREACEKFVGPMPVKKFLSEFVPKAAKQRPANETGFHHPSASQKENEFVSRLISRGIDAHEYYIDWCNGSIWSLPRAHAHQHPI